MRPLVMGVLNVTPDSFFDGGQFFEHEAAIAWGHTLIDQGADVIDVGGESSRPGAEPVELEEELRRVLPVVEALSSRSRVSIDTMKAEVATQAIGAGASLINDVSATLVQVAAAHEAGLIVMHMQGTPKTMQISPHYDDVVAEVQGELVKSASLARRQGVREVYIDPGIGFGKTDAHNLALIRHLPDLVATGERVVVGTSRKGFIGRLLAPSSGAPLGVEERLEGSLATAVFALCAGVEMVRVHDVAATVAAAKLVGDVNDDPQTIR